MSLQNPIRTALLSYGMSGEIFHAPLLSVHQGFLLTKIMERSSDKARHRYPEVSIVRTLDEVLADKTVELVIVNTPHATHADLAFSVLDAGKHVIVEKPFTTTVEEGRRLMARAKEKGLQLAVFQSRRWDGDFMTVRKIIQSGRLGRIVEFEAHYDRYRPVVDHKIWKEIPGAGSGILYNLGAHMIDQALVLFGLPSYIDARLGIQRIGGTSDDFYDLRLQYDDGMLVILKSSYLVREHGPRYVIHGEAGSFRKYGLDPQEQALKEGAVPGTAGWGAELPAYYGTLTTTIDGLAFTSAVETLAGNYGAFYDAIYSAIREGKALPVTAEEALQVIRLIALAVQSNKEKKALPVR